MSRADFVTQLEALGHSVSEAPDGLVQFPYRIPVGKLAGKDIRIGFVVSNDFPLNPPSGPHVSPRLLPTNQTAGPHPIHGVHPSQFGEDWQYWSRPFPNWAATDRRVDTYMAFIRRLFATL